MISRGTVAVTLVQGF